jgi:mono/diheme cytochrome c family protein
VRRPQQKSRDAALGGAWLGATIVCLGAAFGLGGAASSTFERTEAESDPDLWLGARAVIERRCLECHGLEYRRGGLSFADAASFSEGGSRGPAFDREDPEKSRLLHAVRYSDPEFAMPPAGRIPDEEIAALEAWIRGGAPWPAGKEGELTDPGRFALEHDEAPNDPNAWWAYRPLRRTGHAGGVGHPIDALIGARLEENGVEAADQASPLALVRRASFDLTGLPPSTEMVNGFLAAWERDGHAAWRGLIDDLLASPAYGERWARHWLDLVRYAETNGYERDGTKTNIWRYRDWVIRSLNEDKPYDRFVTEQLAGDELVEALGLKGAEASAALIATGYYRLGVWDDEPSDPAQARADELADIVDTTGQALLGATIGCARCHDHKADPISQADYYAFTAVFNNIKGYGGGSFGQHLGGGMTTPIADAPAPGVMTPQERDSERERVLGELARYIAMLPAVEGEPETVLGDARGAQRDARPVWRYVEGEAPDGWTSPGFDDSGWESGPGGFGTRGTPGAVVGTRWDSNRIFLRTRFALTEIPESLVLSIHHDEDAAVWINGVQVAAFSGYTSKYKRVQLDRDAMSALVVGSNVVAVSCRQTGGGQYIDVGLASGWIDGQSADVIRLRTVAEHVLSGADVADAQRLLVELREIERAPIADAYPALVISERGTTAPTQHVLMRGSAHAPGDAVEPGVPGVFAVDGQPDFEQTASQVAFNDTTGRRLALARWLFGPGSHITSRVMANRLWQHHFGRGLCRTSGDFGRLGEEPTHPLLLDHLAAELIERSWSLKAMHRYIMTSEAYMRSSVGPSASLAADPRNNLFWRFDPRRLSAEEFRDAVLDVSGMLVDEMYGPSAFPTMPPEALATSSRPGEAWGRAAPGDEGRRSVYVFAKRSLRLPLLEALDQPSPDMACPVRFPTNVPTQALITLNSDFMQEAAGAFADRVLSESDDLEGAIARAIELALGRDPGREEVARHASFVQRLREEHDLSERDALAVLCLGVMNLNEFMWID